MTPGNKNSYKSLKKISINSQDYNYYSLKEAEKNGLKGIDKLPKSLKVLLENLLRYEDGLSVTQSQIESIKEWLKTKKSKTEIAYRPARVLLQDYTGIPAVADLAAMREAVKEKNKDPNTINPLSAVDLVIDHSVQVDQSAKNDSFEKNVDIEFERNGERYSFLKWGQEAFNNFRIVPPGTGICHQVNLEYLSKVVWSEEFKGEKYIFPDTLVGTDSHTTMVNGLSVLGWGVGGIEAEAGMLGQPISMLIPEVIDLENIKIQRILELKDDFARLGLIREKFGEGAILVREIPSILGDINVKNLVIDIVDELEEFGSSTVLEDKLGHICGTIACHSSVRSGRTLRVEEMNALLREMEATPHSGQCNHGRPTYVELKLSDIEKLFGRR